MNIELVKHKLIHWIKNLIYVMVHSIRYSPKALIEYESILDYIIQHFGLSKAMEVDSYFEKIISPGLTGRKTLNTQ